MMRSTSGLFVTAAALVVAAGLAAQSPQAPAGGWAFEVASIKANNSGDGRVFAQTQPGRMTMTNVPLKLLIRQAYQLQDFQITGGPGWITTEHFDINAKMPDGFQPTPGPPPAPGGPPTPIQQMLRALLAERFKLAVHNETKDLPIYALIVARSDGRLGTQLKRSETDCAAQFAANARGGGRGPMPPPGPPQPGEQIPCGMRIGPGNMVMGGSPLSQFANSLGMFTGRVVLDRTGLTGNYDVSLTWTPDQMPQRPPGAPDPLINGVAVDPNGPSLFTAVQEQLGLKLDSQRGPVEMLVIDRAEKPVEEYEVRSTKHEARSTKAKAAATLTAMAQATSRTSDFVLRTLASLVLCLFALPASAAIDFFGRVTFGDLAVPGATVTAVHGDQQIVTVTDQDGVFHFTAIAEGRWTIRVEMLAFARAMQDVTIAAGAPASSWELKLLPLAEMTRGLTPAAARPEPARPAHVTGNRPANSAPATAAPSTGFQRAQVNSSAAGEAIVNEPTAAGDADRGGADGFLINGSVNNGAASPFAQLAAFGNNRRNVRSLYNGGVGLLLGNSALDARPFSFTGQQTPRPSYSDAQVIASFAGPLRIPRLITRNAPNLFLGYQRTVDHNASTQSALMPTAAERVGDFSKTRDALGRAIQLVDPVSGRPFADNVIPRILLSPQAASLLNYYPLPNVDAAGRFNYQAPVLETRHQDAAQARVSQALSGGRNQIFGSLALQRTTTDAGNVFGFTDSSRASGVDSTLNWSHRFSQLLSLRLRYQFTRLTSSVTPYFANRINVSGEAGIAGNDQDPINWGAPRLLFSSGIAGLGSAQAADNHNTTHGWGAEILSSRGRHSMTVGGDVRRQSWAILAQQDARGTFGFSGGATGLDVADFVLGLPHSSSIAFGNADKDFVAPAFDAYVTDDWRVSPILTVNAGVRWEYEGPIDERLGRLANLDVAPGFTSIRPVVGNDPIRPDRRGVQPRIGLALRPVAGSSLVIRAGYGIYRNSSVYEPIALLLAQQPPLSKTLSVETGAAGPLTLADGFTGVPGAMLNTFAVDPDFRVGYAHNWQILAQRDLPASLTLTATYLGTHGSDLMQELLPNTVPAGAVNACPSCLPAVASAQAGPAGFVYLTSNGHSDRHTGQLQLRRRLRNGLTAAVQYTLSKAMDDAGAFSGVSTSGSAIAQDWLHPDAEWAPSNFDQRHLVTGQVQYTSGAGVSGGGIMDGRAAKFFRGWTLTSQLTAGSGLPITPVYLTSVAGTGVTGTIRASVTGASADAPDGYYVNPAAYTVPASGQWGNAGRNSIVGPRVFSLDAGIGRTFLWGDRLNLDWRMNATNIVNRVTYAAVNAIVGSPQFGLPTIANPMRKVQTSLRVRF